MSTKKPDDEKIANIAPFGLRMPPSLRDRVKATAEARGRSMNAEIISTLELAYPPDDAPLPGEPMDKDLYSSFLADEDEIWSIIRTVDELKDRLIRNHQASLRRDRRESSSDDKK